MQSVLVIGAGVGGIAPTANSRRADHDDAGWSTSNEHCVGRLR